MIKPEDIPDAFWEKAVDLVNEFKYDDAVQNFRSPSELADASWYDVSIIAQALMAAKLEAYEEAAKVAEDDDGHFTHYGQDKNSALAQRVASDAAAAIRKLGQPK